MKKLMKLFGVILFASTILTSCGDEYDYIRYKAKDNEFSKIYGEPVYIDIDFGNLTDPYAVMAILADEEGVNVFGKLFGGNIGMSSIITGKYSIKNGYVFIDWQQQNIIDDLPTKLKINKDGFDGKRLNCNVPVLIDEQGKLEYHQYKYGNGKM